MALDKIEHIVHVMLENRSFDSMLGWLYEHDSPGHVIGHPLSPKERTYEGLQGLNLSDFTNHAHRDGNPALDLAVAPVRGASGLNVPDFAPGEEFNHVTKQLFGESSPSADPTMKGYLQDFLDVLTEDDVDAARLGPAVRRVMESYTPDQLPVICGLAKHYAVCDMWFSSIPSQTNGNRAFAFTGTSTGLVDNGFLEGELAKEFGKVIGVALGDDRFPTPTIWNALTDHGRNSWKIFWSTSLAPAKLNPYTNPLMTDAALAALAMVLPPPAYAALLIVISRLKLPQFQALLEEVTDDNNVEGCYMYRLFPHLAKLESNFNKVDEFHRDARSGSLPRYSFIEPIWTAARYATSAGALALLTQKGNEYHPPSNLNVGEYFLRDIYESLIANTDSWNKTLLIITFDEPVGSFDHVPPTAKVRAPWDQGMMPAPQAAEEDFDFHRLGGRVPAILVSPLIEKGTVFRSDNPDRPFDHTSVLSTVLKWEGLNQEVVNSFGARTADAPTFERVVTRASPRTDARDLDFFRTERPFGQQFKYFDSFYLRDAAGEYVAGYREEAYMDLKTDFDVTEYFPHCGEGPRQAFYLQKQDERANTGGVLDGHNVRLIARNKTLRYFNVLGGFNSHFCYYSDDYLDNVGAQPLNDEVTWILHKNGSGQLSFGDQISLENVYWRTKSGGFLVREAWPSAVHVSSSGSYVVCQKPPAFWTVVPCSPTIDAPANAIRYGDSIILQHIQTGKFVSPPPANYPTYPTYGGASKEPFCFELAGCQNEEGAYVLLGDSVHIVSTRARAAGGPAYLRRYDSMSDQPELFYDVKGPEQIASTDQLKAHWTLQPTPGQTQNAHFLCDGDSVRFKNVWFGGDDEANYACAYHTWSGNWLGADRLPNTSYHYDWIVRRL